MDENNEMQNEPLASEIYGDLKEQLKWMRWMIALLIFGILAQGAYHNWRWSQFDTYDIDAGESGYATFVGGDNAGGVYNGPDRSAAPEGRQGAGSQG